MRFLVGLLFTALSVISPLVAFAQATDAPTLNVEPQGVARQPWQIVRDIVLTVPSPAGEALPGVVDGTFGPGGASASMNLDGRFQVYGYDCGATRCQGFATEIWRSLGRDVQQSYIDSIMDALVAAFPDEPRYAVWVEGQDGNGYQGARVEQNSTGERHYRFVGR